MVSSDLTSHELTEHLKSILRDTADDAVSLAEIDPEALVSSAEAHAVLPLVAARLLPRRDLPEALRPRLEDAARRAVVDDLVQEAELKRLIHALSAAGLRPVLMKGAHLAYAYYERPDLRPRVDADLLVARGDEAAAARELQRLGYAPREQSHGDLVSYQSAYALTRNGATLHVVDLHWRIANPQRFGQVLSYEDANAAAEPVPSLGPDARALSPVHALLIACVHPVAHHANQHCLLWQYDIHLVASEFDDEDWREFAAVARAGGVAGVCRASLARAFDDFGLSIPREAWFALVDSTGADAGTSAYLAGGRRHVQRVWWDLRSLPTWHERSRLLRQHLFPSAQYMRQVYAPSSGAPLPWLYARRVWHGAQKWLTRT
ncbi:MAG TPA: nucleotidyltransferase family protein [Vicinamibacterales bacterium]|nr:nucleotidyltransferase family protein [Vicinamibacterales bacterium]